MLTSDKKYLKGNTILAVLLTILLLGITAIYLMRLGAVKKEGVNPTITPGIESRFKGTVKKGGQLGEVKNYCTQGLYLVADKGEYLANQTTMLLLQVAGGNGQSKMLDEDKYIDKKVVVYGKYPAQEVFCEALTCGCEDYILVKEIEVVSDQ